MLFVLHPPKMLFSGDAKRKTAGLRKPLFHSVLVEKLVAIWCRHHGDILQEIGNDSHNIYYTTIEHQDSSTWQLLRLVFRTRRDAKYNRRRREGRALPKSWPRRRTSGWSEGTMQRGFGKATNVRSICDSQFGNLISLAPGHAYEKTFSPVVWQAPCLVLVRSPNRRTNSAISALAPSCVASRRSATGGRSD